VSNVNGHTGRPIDVDVAGMHELNTEATQQLTQSIRVGLDDCTGEVCGRDGTDLVNNIRSSVNQFIAPNLAQLDAVDSIQQATMGVREQNRELICRQQTISM
jgi:hypothetical protein